MGGAQNLDIDDLKEKYKSLAKKATRGNQWIDQARKTLPKRPVNQLNLMK